MTFTSRFAYWYALLALTVPNIALSITEPMSALQAAANIVLPTGIVWLLLSLSRKVGASVWALFPLLFIGAFQMVLLMLYGRGVIAVDMYLNVVTTNPSEVGELLGGLIPALLVVGVLYLPPLVGATVALVRHGELTERMTAFCRKASLVVISAGLLLLGCCFIAPTPYRPLRQLYPLNAFYNLCLAVDRYRSGAAYPASADGFAFHAVANDSVPSLTVIVIGETSRAANWQLMGYGRPTTPRLAATEGLVPFPRALTQSNTTHKSVPLMLSHLAAGAVSDSIYKVKSIITAFSEAGASTAFVSNQARSGGMIDAFGAEADTVIFLADRIREGRTDLDILPVADSLIASLTSGRSALMVIHTYGSHYCYNDRYPRSMATFRPDGPLEAEASFRQALINAYDNTIRLTDLFISSLIEMMEHRGLNASLIYTSDHGEDIFDDSRNLFLHASPVPSFAQLHVPLVIWMSDAYRSRYPDRYAALQANSRLPVATSTALPHTAMMLAGIVSPRLDTPASLASRDYSPRPYTYLDDHNEAVTPLQGALDAADTARIDSLWQSR